MLKPTVSRVFFWAGLALAAQAFAEPTAINKTTSYWKQNEYYCRLAVEADVKPAPVALDHFRLHDVHRGIADLYGNGTIDMVFGASDETFSLKRVSEQDQNRWPSWVYEGNQERSRKAHQYAFYSPDPDFKVPAQTRFLNARSIVTQDFNGDGIDDLAFAIWGTDYEPYKPLKNEILLSTVDGYKTSYLPGQADFAHGATAGDLDNDGDVDILVTGADSNFRSGVYLYKNDGQGQFSRHRIHSLPDTFVVSLYDIDNDGNLDLFLVKNHNQTSTLQLYWGKGDGSFSPNPLSIFSDEWLSKKGSFKRGNSDTYTRFRHRKFKEPVFADTNNNGNLNVLVPSNMDFHFSLFDLELDGREVVNFREVFRTIEARDPALIPDLNWLNACDLNGEGIDLVFEKFGQAFYGNSAPGTTLDFSRTNKAVFKNDGTGNFTFFKLEDPQYFGNEYHPLLKAYSEHVGVTAVNYKPKQIYHPNIFDQSERFIHPSYTKLRGGVLNLPYNSVPNVTEELGYVAINGDHSATASSVAKASNSELSPRAKRILEQRGTTPSNNQTLSPKQVEGTQNVSEKVRRLIEIRRQRQISE